MVQQSVWLLRLYRVATTLLCLGVFLLSRDVVQPAAAAGYGVHVLNPDEISQVSEAFASVRAAGEPLYVTIPFSLQDVGRLAQWQQAFNLAKEKNIVPLVRVVSEFSPEKNAWSVPDRRQMIGLVKSLSMLEWPQEQRHVILFNEPNHHAEWGGQVDPTEFAKVTTFLAQWFKTENKNYVLLPAAADLAAPDGPTTWEAFHFWSEVLKAEPTYFDQFDAWNSHSYPNPGFVASPNRTGKNSLRGFEHELEFLAEHTNPDKEWPVFITETGWKETPQNRRLLKGYYQTAHRTVWNHSQVVAVTPFVWRGAPGPFADFSFVDAESQPTPQFTALQQIWHDQTKLLTQRAEASIQD